jgi:hypothetical protein
MNQTITINKEWQIVRLDPKNWQIQNYAMLKEGKNAGGYEWKEMGYYATLRQALFALPDKMLDAVANGTLTDVKNALAGIRSAIKAI